MVAAAGITTSGNARAIVAAVGMGGTPKTVTVPVTTGAHTAAALIATAFRTALLADADVAAFFNVGGTGADITLQARTPIANDATMNFTIEDVTSAGIVNSLVSVNTTAGVADTGMANAVVKLGGGHGVLNFYGCQDEAFRYFIINDVSDIASQININGTLVQSEILLNQSCKLTAATSNFLSKLIKDGTVSSSSKIHATNCHVRTDDKYGNTVSPPQLMDFSGGGSIAFVEENPDNTELRYRLPARFLTDKTHDQDSFNTIPIVAIGHYSTFGTRPHFRIGLTDINGVFNFASSGKSVGELRLG